MIRNGDGAFDKSSSIWCKIQVALLQWTLSLRIKLVFILTDLAGITNSQICDFEFLFVNSTLQPPKAELCPLLWTHAAANNFYVCHVSDVSLQH